MSEIMGNEHYAVLPNALGGESLYVPPGADLMSVPSPFRELLTYNHAAIYARPRDYLTWLTRRARLPGMHRWFAAMAATSQCGLHLHRAEMGGNLQTDVIVRGFLPGPARFSDFRLSSDEPVFDLPTALQDVYELIDGTIEGRAFEAGGFEKLSCLLFDSSSYRIADSHPIANLDDALWFYGAGNGDYIIADGNRAFWFLHGDCSFVEAGNLTEVVDSYFTSILTASEWLRDPYRSPQ